MRRAQARVGHDIAPANHGSEDDAVRRSVDLAKVRQLAQVDQQGRRGEAERQHRHEALTAPDQLRGSGGRGDHMALPLSLAVCDYDRPRAIFDGRATIEGCDITAVPVEPEEAFHRAFKFSEFDISEISLSSYIMTTARGDAQYIAIPAFVSRLFRHTGIYIRTNRGIGRPQDMKAKTIGLPQSPITPNVRP